MSDSFRDPFSEAELNRMLGGGEDESPAASRFRAFLNALWEFFTPANAALGDARTLGFIVIIELEDTEGNRWMRYATANGDGRAMPAWTARGYLTEALADINDGILCSGGESPSEE